MYCFIHRFKNKPFTYIMNILTIFVLLVFVCFAIGTKMTNEKVGDFLFGNLGVNYIVYGDINDIQGYASDEEELLEIKDIYEEMIAGLKEIGGNHVAYETCLLTNRIYAASDIHDEELYRILYLDDNDIRLIGNSEYGSYTNDYLSFISRDFANNRQYVTALESVPNHYDPLINNEDQFRKYSWGFIPTLVGVNSPRWSDMILGYMDIEEGRSFTEEEIMDGDFVCIVNNDNYVIDLGGFEEVEVGDIIPLTVEVGNFIKTFEFEVIGINDAYPRDGMKIMDSLYMESRSYANMLDNNYYNFIYVPQSCFDEILNTMLDESYAQNLLPEKIAGDDSTYQNVILSGNEVFYSQYGGIRPLVIEVSDQDKLESIAVFIDDEIEKLNAVSNRVIDYTYFSNLDRFATVISSVNINEMLFAFLSIFAILSCLLFFMLHMHNDIEKSKKEIGIAIALGKNKKQVMFDKFKEYLCLSTLPLILSILLAYLFMHLYLQSLQNNIIDIGLGATVFSSYVNTIEVDIPYYFIIIYILIITLCLLLSCLYGYYRINKLNIKEILLEGEGL